jgi:hypothetical protein
VLPTVLPIAELIAETIRDDSVADRCQVLRQAAAALP